MNMTRTAGGPRRWWNLPEVLAALVFFATGCTVNAGGPSPTASPSELAPEQLPEIVSPSDAATTEGPELYIQTGHVSEGVHAVIFGPGGRWLASGRDRHVKLWDVETGRELRTLAGHTHWVSNLAVSPDGSRLASASAFENTVKLWDVMTGRLLRSSTVGARAGAPRPLALSQDARLAATSDRDVTRGTTTLTIIDVESGRTLQALTASKVAGLEYLAFSPDSRLLAWATMWVDAGIDLWDIASGRIVRTLSGYPGYALAFSGDGRLLASGSADGFRVWDVSTGRKLLDLPGPHTHPSQSVAFSPDGRLLVTSGGEVTSDRWELRVWEVHTGRQLAARESRQPFGTIAFSPDGRFFATTGAALFTAAGEPLDRTLPAEGDAGEVVSVAFSADGRRLFSGRLTHKTAADGAVLQEYTLRGWQISSDAGSVSSRDQTHTMTLGRMEFTVPAWIYSPAGEASAAKGHTGPVEFALLSSDGQRLLSTSGRDRHVTVWDPTRGEHLRTLSPGPIDAAAVSPDGGSVALGFFDRSVALGHPPYSRRLELWDLGAGKRIRTLWEEKPGEPFLKSLGEVIRGKSERAVHSVTALAFSPDGRSLASGEEILRYFHHQSLFAPEKGRVEKRNEYAITLRNIQDGRPVGTLHGHPGRVAALAFSPDGRLLASGSEQHRIFLWDVTTGRRLHALAGHTSRIRSLAFSPDGRWLASGGGDGTTRLWEVRTGRLLATLVSLRNGSEWLVAAPDGLFDSSLSAMRRILWRFGGRTFDVAPVEIFFNEFFHPGLLADVIAGRRPTAPRDLARIDRRQPTVAVALTDRDAARPGAVSSRTVAVRVEVSEAPGDGEHAGGSGVRDVRLFRNGSLAKIWRGDVLPPGRSQAVLEATIPLVAGENQLVAYAFNRDNIKSPDATLLVSGAESLRRAGAAFIIAIGVNRYANPLYNLRYAVSDASAFAEELQRHQVALRAFSRVEVIPLLDEEATRANILGALRRLAGTESSASPSVATGRVGKLGRIEPEDLVVIYFAGHGISHSGRFFLVPHDAAHSGGRIPLEGQDLEAVLGRSISDLEIERAFERIDAGRILLVIDACAAGQALEAEEWRRGPMNSKGLAQLAYEKGVYVLAAAQGYQAALEIARLGHGLLTYALVSEGLNTTAADTSPPDGRVVVEEWFDYAVRRVPELQLEEMRAARASGRDIAVVDGEEKIEDLSRRSIQQPRAFYRREPERNPLVVAVPGARR